jgi:hypothetical protein
VKIYQSILTYLLIFLALALILKIFGIISLSGSELVGYAFVFFGVSSSYVSFGQDQPLSLFLGTIIFLIGILLYIVNNFLIFWNSQLYLPTSLLMVGIAFLMVYYDDTKRKKVIILSGIFLLLGIIFTITIGNISFVSFYGSMFRVAGNYWPVIIITIGILFLVWWEEKGHS